MTTKSGRAFALLWVLVLGQALGGATARAALTAELDRQQVALGDTLRLTVTATEGEDLDDIDLRSLQQDFEILQRSSSSTTRIVNGRSSHTRQLLLDITPRREGTLKIPPLQAGGRGSPTLLVTVGAAPKVTDTAGQEVLFEAEVDRDRVYVQGQVILTLRVMQAINLEDRSITDLQLEDAFVRPLEQKSFQRNIGGRPWLVHEVRYAIFPEHSGSLEIPAQTFAGREVLPRRSFFDLGGGGRQLRRNSQPLTVEVLPRPADYPQGTWLPARDLRVTESWSTPPDQLRAGESTTRTIRIEAQGLQGAQLPEILFPATDGLKYYPDQPAISDAESDRGLVGQRQDSAAIVPTRAGSWSIPEIRIPWWDTETDELRYAVVPGRELVVAAAQPSAASPAPAPTAVPEGAVQEVQPSLIPTVPAATGGDALPWQILAAVCGLGWLATLAWLWWGPRPRAAGDDTGTDSLTERQAFKQLAAACDSDDPQATRRAMIAWTRAALPDSAVVSLEEAGTAWADRELATELACLDAVLYGDGQQRWTGAALLRALRRLRGLRQRARADDEPPLELYPETAQIRGQFT